MIDTKRRRVLKQILGASAASLAGSFSWAALGSGGLPLDPPTKHLNVLFHGLFAIVVSPQGIEVLAPTVNDHEYMVGTWLHELRLGKNHTYILQGVSNNRAFPSSLVSTGPVRKNHPVFDNWRNVDASVLQCKLVLPFPESISALRPVLRDPDEEFYKGPKAPSAPPNRLPLVTAITYTVTGPVTLKPLAWQPSWKGGTANLHVWAEPGIAVPDQHALQAFEQFKALFRIPKGQITLNGHYLHSKGDIANDVNRPPGVSPDEERGTLAGRSKRPHILVTSPANCIAPVVSNS